MDAKTTSVLTLALLWQVSASASHWPSFRGPDGTGVGDGPVATRWDLASGTNVRWQVPLMGLSHASPIVWGEAVYVLSAVGEGSSLDTQAQGVVFAKDMVRHEWRLHCLDLATGRERWTKVVHRGVPRQARHVRGTYANATPATDGRHIAAVLGNEGLFVLDMNGDVRWHAPMAPDTPEWSLDAASSPIIVDGVVIVQNDWRRSGFVGAYDVQTGRELWRVKREEGLSWSTPGVYGAPGSRRIVLNSPRWVTALDPRDGREVWRMNNEAEGAWDRVPTPFAAEGLVVVAGGGGERPLYAIRPAAAGDITLRPDQRASDSVAWKTERGSPYLPTPIVYRGLVYVCASNGVLTVYRASDGTLVYQQRLAADAGVFSASPVAADGRVYFASEDGDVFVVAAGTRFDVVARNAVGAPVFATPALAGGIMVIRTATGVVALG